MSTAQQIIEKNFDQIRKDVEALTEDDTGVIPYESKLLYKAIREFVYEYMYDSSTVDDVDDAEDAKYIANKYDDDYYYNGTTLDS
jgi:hypothetical protein|tara:strand:+ start:231 stop:485 length:255 start_codon:yes stop_codon:yes gene_type:complete